MADIDDIPTELKAGFDTVSPVAAVSKRKRGTKPELFAAIWMGATQLCNRVLSPNRTALHMIVQRVKSVLAEECVVRVNENGKPEVHSKIPQKPIDMVGYACYDANTYQVGK